ncbi:MAG: hypothetical protein WCN92_08070 [Eubacteriales bacterium]
MNFITGNAKLVHLIVKPLSVLIVFVMTLTSNSIFKPGIIDMPVVPESFTPIVRFTVTSDVHLKDSGGEAEAYRLGLMIKSSYDIAASSSYNKLDGGCLRGRYHRWRHAHAAATVQGYLRRKY